VAASAVFDQQEEEMHPLNTLIESQRRQVRHRNQAPVPTRRSATEENATYATQAKRRGRVAVAVALITSRLTGR
jgi:hypothetical protein